MSVALLAGLLAFSAAPFGPASPSAWCREAPVLNEAAGSIGRASQGRLLGAQALQNDQAVRVLPRRHQARCLNWATPRLVEALARAGRTVQASMPGSPPLGVGDLSRAVGGPIPPYSRSHQSGRDADLAFYQLDASGRPLAAEDLVRFSSAGTAPSGHFFDVRRNWLLVKALITDAAIDVQWLFVSNALRKRLLDEASRLREHAEVLAKASEVLHQPTDSGPHSDHFHLRIRCTDSERTLGCQG